MRRLVLLLTTLACLSVPAALAKGSFPETIPLPNGFQPEGIAVGKGDTFYVGSIPTGAVYAGSLRTGTGNVLVPGATGHAATGLKYDRAGCGSPARRPARRSSTAPQPARSSRSSSSRPVQARRSSTTSSSRGGRVLHRLQPPGDLQGLEVLAWRRPAAVTAIPLTGDYQHVPGFNLNGIDATPSGKTLLAVQSATGKPSRSTRRPARRSSSTSAAQRFRTVTASSCTAGRSMSCRTS